MKRNTPLRSDPAKVREWKRRSRAIKRTVARTVLPTPKPITSRKPRGRSETSVLRKSKKLVAKRSEGKCEVGVPGICSRQAVHFHHRKMRSQGITHTPPNLRHVCLPCHDWIHGNPRLSYLFGWLLRMGQVPLKASALRFMRPNTNETLVMWAQLLEANKE